mmetsp:Transcript_11199/g.30133  ORF Transcript_11199/g.30133 Transcript_11199/m.30133 type:complete len:240 (+) Transcript_11199:1362-2081(+)
MSVLLKGLTDALGTLVHAHSASARCMSCDCVHCDPVRAADFEKSIVFEKNLAFRHCAVQFKIRSHHDGRHTRVQKAYKQRAFSAKVGAVLYVLDELAVVHVPSQADICKLHALARRLNACDWMKPRLLPRHPRPNVQTRAVAVRHPPRAFEHAYSISGMPNRHLLRERILACAVACSLLTTPTAHVRHTSPPRLVPRPQHRLPPSTPRLPLLPPPQLNLAETAVACFVHHHTRERTVFP